MTEFTYNLDEMEVHAEGGSGAPPYKRIPAKRVTADFSDKDREELARRAWLAGYELGKGVEELKPISIRTAEERFERWWKINED